MPAKAGIQSLKRLFTVLSIFFIYGLMYGCPTSIPVKSMARNLHRYRTNIFKDSPQTQRTQRKNLMPSGKSNDRIMIDINKLSSEIMRDGIVRIVNKLDE